jgi:hypothetical protein
MPSGSTGQGAVPAHLVARISSRAKSAPRAHCLREANVLRPPQLEHAVQRGDSNGHLSRLPRFGPQAQRLTDHALVGYFARFSARELDPRDVRTSLTVLGRRFLDLVLSPDAIALHRIILGEVTRFPGIR